MIDCYFKVLIKEQLLEFDLNLILNTGSVIELQKLLQYN